MLLPVALEGLAACARQILLCMLCTNPEAALHRYRVWSVAHSVLQPNLTASAADDGVVRLWSQRNLCGPSTALVPARGAAVCGVEFCAQDSNLLAVAGCDSSAYVYDLRNW